MKELEIYIHIPFCMKKCAYCDFLSFPAEFTERLTYVKRLIEEIRYYAPEFRDYRVSSVFLGGGTPSILEGYHISAVMRELSEQFQIEKDAEISVECNPGTLTAAKAEAFVEAGINRVSLGLQSADDGELRLLGRIHNFEQFLESFDDARKAGCHNINVDLMSALPAQTPESWERTLKKVAALHPEHISAYSLILEEGTPFFERYREDELLRQKGGTPSALPTEEEERRMYDLTGRFLARKGYARYEISNYARPGRECRHNIGYWTRKNYLGLGLGASSLIENIRFQNTSDLNVYMNRPFSHLEEQKLSRKEQMEEFMFLGLRLTEGISRAQFQKNFGTPIESIYGDVVYDLKQEGFMQEREGRLFLTGRGIDVSNQILAEFLL